LLEYKIGDYLKWGAYDEGIPGQKSVVAYAVAENCPLCKYEISDIPGFEVYIEQDKIVAIRSASGLYNLVAHDPSYIVLEE
jgi:hypothetical protein